ncbi:hypothetical protein BDN72DRAFT_480306 [Pluteus cervinus]|uniref:Uncharacterized protein n=1 Tax=Pluteus cervinus TaxID=181527 RepID=A0ACD3AZE2_9AGAR|nr:hypothetical protein BDN72DRAFT_480306 [Pluteus cervinus]
MDIPSGMYVMQCLAVGAVTFQICELFSFLGEEVEYFWKEKYTLTKVVYLWSRYFPLGAQIFNLVITHMAQVSYPQTNSARLCSIGFVFKSILAQMTLEAIEAILMVRLHALYNRSRRTGAFLVTIFLFNVIMHTYANILSIRSLIAVPSCAPPKAPPRTLIFFGVSAILGQSVIFIMTLGKYACGIREGWRRCPLALLMLRDGASAYALLFVTISVMVSIELMRSLTDLMLGGIFVWYVAIVSVVGCRIVLNLCRLLRQNSLGSDHGRENDFSECDSRRTSSPVFTSVEDLGSIEWLGHSLQSFPAIGEECALELSTRRLSVSSASNTCSSRTSLANKASYVFRKQTSAAETSNDAIDAKQGPTGACTTGRSTHHSLSSPLPSVIPSM